MKFTDKQLLGMPQQCLTNRQARHEWHRHRHIGLAWLLIWVWVMTVRAGIVEAERGN